MAVDHPSQKRKTRKRKNTKKEGVSRRTIRRWAKRQKTRNIDDIIGLQVAHRVIETPATAEEDQGRTLQIVMPAETISDIRKSHLVDEDVQGLEVFQVMKTTTTTIAVTTLATPLLSLITTADQLFSKITNLAAPSKSNSHHHLTRLAPTWLCMAADWTKLKKWTNLEERRLAGVMGRGELWHRRRKRLGLSRCRLHQWLWANNAEIALATPQHHKQLPQPTKKRRVLSFWARCVRTYTWTVRWTLRNAWTDRNTTETGRTWGRISLTEGNGVKLFTVAKNLL